MQTQKEMVLAYINENGSITPKEAYDELGVMRLSAVIFDLRAEGHEIATDSIKGINRFGAKTCYARYSLKK